MSTPPRDNRFNNLVVQNSVACNSVSTNLLGVSKPFHHIAFTPTSGFDITASNTKTFLGKLVQISLDIEVLTGTVIPPTSDFVVVGRVDQKYAPKIQVGGLMTIFSIPSVISYQITTSGELQVVSASSGLSGPASMQISVTYLL